jgi:hypothetical protein
MQLQVDFVIGQPIEARPPNKEGWMQGKITKIEGDDVQVRSYDPSISTFYCKRQAVAAYGSHTSFQISLHHRKSNESPFTYFGFPLILSLATYMTPSDIVQEIQNCLQGFAKPVPFAPILAIES